MRRFFLGGGRTRRKGRGQGGGGRKHVFFSRGTRPSCRREGAVADSSHSAFSSELTLFRLFILDPGPKGRKGGRATGAPSTAHDGRRMTHRILEALPPGHPRVKRLAHAPNLVVSHPRDARQHAPRNAPRAVHQRVRRESAVAGGARPGGTGAHASHRLLGGGERAGKPRHGGGGDDERGASRARQQCVRTPSQLSPRRWSMMRSGEQASTAGERLTGGRSHALLV